MARIRNVDALYPLSASELKEQVLYECSNKTIVTVLSKHSFPVFQMSFPNDAIHKRIVNIENGIGGYSEREHTFRVLPKASIEIITYSEGQAR